MEPQRDIWTEWLLKRRFGGNAEVMQRSMEYLHTWRDHVLDHAALADGDILLDVGCGDGLIAFGALQRVPSSYVIFSDISQDLLDHVQPIAQQMGVANRCQFVRASADALSPIGDGSVDVVTTRSVLIYVGAKQTAFDEFYRVLKPEGRLSIFEPINRFSFPEPDHIFMGCDVTPIIEIVRRVKAVFERIQPPDHDPMLNFDERDLLSLAERAGLSEIHMELQVEIKPAGSEGSWETAIQIAGNPKIPSIEEAMRQALTPAEQDAFVAHLRPLFESGQRKERSAVAYLWAHKKAL
jgi:arsenite methyltransferase